MVAVHVFYSIVYIIRKTNKKFKQIYYSDDGYWRGKIAIQRLAKVSGSTKEEAEKWLLRQPLYQIYLPAPKYVSRLNASIPRPNASIPRPNASIPRPNASIPRPNASMSLFAKPNDIHQSDLLSLSHDKFKKKTYKYALNIVDVVLFRWWTLNDSSFSKSYDPFRILSYQFPHSL